MFAQLEGNMPAWHQHHEIRLRPKSPGSHGLQELVHKSGSQ